MSSLRRRTLWRVMLVLVLGSALLALYNYHDSRHEIAEVYDAHLAQNARLLQGVLSLPLHEQHREDLYQALDVALGKAGRRGSGTPTRASLRFRSGATMARCWCVHRARQHSSRRRPRQGFPMWWWMDGNGAVLSCRCPTSTGSSGWGA